MQCVFEEVNIRWNNEQFKFLSSRVMVWFDAKIYLCLAMLRGVTRTNHASNY